MKRGKKSKLTLGVILMLAVMFVGTTVVAAAGDPTPAFTWAQGPTPAGQGPILAGDRDAIILDNKDVRTVIFNSPEEMVFEAKYDLPVTNGQGEVIDWDPEATSALFTMSPEDVYKNLPVAAEPSTIWHYMSARQPEPKQTIGQYGTYGQAWHAFSVPDNYFVELDVQYKWSGMPTDSQEYRWAKYHTEGIITVEKGQPVLSDHLHQAVNRDTHDEYNMNHLAIQAGAQQINAPDKYERFYTTWHRDPHGLYVTANKTAAGHGDDNYILIMQGGGASS